MVIISCDGRSRGCVLVVVVVVVVTPGEISVVSVDMIAGTALRAFDGKSSVRFCRDGGGGGNGNVSSRPRCDQRVTIYVPGATRRPVPWNCHFFVSVAAVCLQLNDGGPYAASAGRFILTGCIALPRKSHPAPCRCRVVNRRHEQLFRFYISAHTRLAKLTRVLGSLAKLDMKSEITISAPNYSNVCMVNSIIVAPSKLIVYPSKQKPGYVYKFNQSIKFIISVAHCRLDFTTNSRKNTSAMLNVNTT